MRNVRLETTDQMEKSGRAVSNSVCKLEVDACKPRNTVSGLWH